MTLGASLIVIAILFLLLRFLIALVSNWFAALRKVRVRKRVVEKARGIAQQQSDALARRRAQLIQRDAYGNVQTEKWAKEIHHFLFKHARPSLAEDEQALLHDCARELTGVVEGIAKAELIARPLAQLFSDNMSPAEFEALCSEELGRAGARHAVHVLGEVT